jgi:hypothetical protein
MAVRISLRRAIDAHCRSCTEDKAAPGTWRGQVTLCPCTECRLYTVRPTTDTIPQSVFEYYGVTRAEKDLLSLKSGLKGSFSEETEDSDRGQAA